MLTVQTETPVSAAFPVLPALPALPVEPADPLMAVTVARAARAAPVLTPFGPAAGIVTAMAARAAMAAMLPLMAALAAVVIMVATVARAVRAVGVAMAATPATAATPAEAAMAEVVSMAAMADLAARAVMADLAVAAARVVPAAVAVTALAAAQRALPALMDWAGTGGSFGGNGVMGYGGGGAGLGGALFVRSGQLALQFATFTGNNAKSGTAWGGATVGQGRGGAVFVLSSLTNSNGNNQGMPAVLATVTSCQISFSGNTADTANADYYGNIGGDPAQACPDEDGNLSAASGVSEPVMLNVTVDTPAEAPDIFDFSLIDGATADVYDLRISDITLHTAGSGDFGKITWRLNGPDTNNITGVYSSTANTLVFSALITVSSGLSETYAVNAYYSDTIGLVEGQSYQLSVDGDTDLSVNPLYSTQMGVTTGVNNGAGSLVHFAPAFSSPPILTATEDLSYSYGISISNITTPVTLTASVKPTWLTLVDNGDGTGTLSGLPTNSRVGVHNVTLQVTDGVDSDTQVFTITVNNTNDTPYFLGAAVTAVDEDSLYSYTINTNDIDVGDILTLTAPISTAWMTLTDNGDGTANLSGTPGIAQVGQYPITLQVTDNGGLVSTQYFTVTVPNLPPIAVADWAQAFISQTTTLPVLDNDSDPDGNPISMAGLSQPAHGVAALIGGQANYTPNAGFIGYDSFIYQLTDGLDTVTGTVRVQVVAHNNAPRPVPDR